MSTIAVFKQRNSFGYEATLVNKSTTFKILLNMGVNENIALAAVCPLLCEGNGIYVHGACQCYPGWKGKECNVPEDECEVPNCNGNGKCVDGKCICSPGYAGKDCEIGTLCMI